MDQQQETQEMGNRISYWAVTFTFSSKTDFLQGLHSKLQKMVGM